MQGLGMFLWFSYPLPIRQRLRAIKEAGFDATALWWGDEFEDKQAQPQMARNLGLDIDYVHAPCQDPNDWWRDGLDGEAYFRTINDCVLDCRRHDIPTLVMHVTRLSSRPEVTSIGLERIKRLADAAQSSQVYVALENLNSIAHLDAIYAQIQSEYVGFCYDSGHENFNHPDADCLTRYGDRLFALHLSDNDGDDDTHLLPYDGQIKWDVITAKLRHCRDVCYLTLEVDFNRRHAKSALYQGTSAERFLALAYERACRLRESYDAAYGRTGEA